MTTQAAEASAPPNRASAIDSTAVEEPPTPPATAAAVPAAPSPPLALAVAPTASAEDLVARLDAIKQAQKKAMEKDVDYGVIPGTDKPTLLKPGAEKLAALFQLDVQPHNEKRWEEDGHLTVVSRVTIFHSPTGARLGSGEGICTTREKKYAYRTATLKCPDCEQATVFRSKHPPRDNPEAEPGWFCWARKGGCGANYVADDERITGQERGQIDNPDLADLWNTVVKMAKKRGFVDAVLAVTGASAIFTQDAEDMASTDLEPDASTRGYPPSAGGQDPSTPKLDRERVDKLSEGIKALKLSYRQINVLLGTAGADGLSENSTEGVAYALERLTPDQADALEGRLQATAEQDGVGS